MGWPLGITIPKTTIGTKIAKLSDRISPFAVKYKVK